MGDHADELDEYKTCVRDVLGLLALPGLWMGRDPRELLSSLLETVEAIVDVDLAYGMVRDPDLELLRIKGSEDATQLPQVKAALESFIHQESSFVGVASCGDLGELHLAAAPLGFFSQRSLIIFGSRRPGFPTPTEWIRLRAAATIATTGMETSRAMREREAANRAKDEFLAMLGHELRNPLAPIVTAIELVKQRGEPSREVHIIERQVSHLVRLVDDLLDIARVTRGKIELKREHVALADIVAKGIETASPLLEGRHHHLEVRVPRDIHVDADPTRLAQVVANLVTNAAKYTPPGGHVEVAALREGATCILSVKDSGVGMSAELLPVIFDPFVQGRTTIHRAEGGLGIGLALVRNIVSLHGGSVRAYSDGTDRGSEIVVRLPILPEGAATPREPSTRRTIPPRGRAARVLVVDDNADAAELLAEVLRSAGHEVEVALDGVQALSIVEKFRPSVLVTDIGLPVIDGYELAARVRDVMGDRSPRMIAVTGYGQEHDHERSQRAGFDRHLVKPVDAQVILDAVRTV
jgi:signal transduction histidine kinase